MGDCLKKVQSGDPLAIPAATFNTFVDAAQDFLRRQDQQAVDATAKAIVKKPVAVYIEKVYDEGDFAGLGIGT